MAYSILSSFNQGLDRSINGQLGVFVPALQNDPVVLTTMKVVSIGGSLIFEIGGGVVLGTYPSLAVLGTMSVAFGSIGIAGVAAAGIYGAYLNAYYPIGAVIPLLPVVALGAPVPIPPPIQNAAAPTRLPV